MATWGYQLLSRIIKTGDINTPLQWGITDDDFLTAEERGIFRLLKTYAMDPNHRSVLGVESLRNILPNFEPCDDDHARVESLCEFVRKQRLASDLKLVIENKLAVCNIDPMRAISELQTAVHDLQRIGTGKVTDIFFHDAFSRQMRRLELMEQGVDMSRGPWPWPPLQDATGGLQDDDYCVVYGRPKQLKTWVVAYLIAWFYMLRKRLLIYTKEMSADNIFLRAGGCLAELPYQHLRMAKWAAQEKAAARFVEDMLHRSRLEQTVVCLSGKDATEGGDNVPWLYSKVEQYKPDVIFIDGLYLLSDARGTRKDFERVRNVSRDIRQMTLELHTPVIATLQANRAAAKNKEAFTDEIAFSDAIGQDVTLLIRVIKEVERNTLLMVLGGVSREFALNGFRIWAIPATNFDYEGPLSMGEIIDAEATEGVGKKAKKGPTEASAVVDVKRQINRLTS